ncbi:(2Fe-2S)-binding protein [Novosphingobium sp. H3SJ31-1]|uniref:Bacterioferritin-associated ferredoxin n=1 Tax=Novosphingobium album (ex Liu et al. 2023) TaxID=3031130 RepID=A0ABT5WT82_9SPHN|nr:(2Fe-2S)-binding protein [Novosphingobium album (ex Liu et al. 2023)]MDE8652677.1 (2Fe-2S)-binding protein [Novosphingobium album (ex Liu et al. 2023)]
MYICICNAIRDIELRAAARERCGDVEAIYHSLGCPPQCRQCIDEAAEIIDEERFAQDLPNSIAA